MPKSTVNATIYYTKNGRISSITYGRLTASSKPEAKKIARRRWKKAFSVRTNKWGKLF